VYLIIALVAAALGFGGIAGAFGRVAEPIKAQVERGMEQARKAT
jgi:Protein of unknown function (DUF1328)